MSKEPYFKNKSLHDLLMFSFKILNIQVANGQYCRMYYIAPVVEETHGHRFGIFTLLSEMHEDVHLVIGLKNMYKLEGHLITSVACFTSFE